MHYAIISDIHSNLEALTVVLDEIKRRKPERIVSLGDVVGYGADPSACLKLICETCHEFVMGNHDEAISDIGLRESFNRDAKRAVEWAAEQLSSEEKKLILGWPRVIIDRSHEMTLTHGSPDQPEDYKYVFGASDARPSFESFQTRVCFIGHTHVPSLFSDAGEVRYLLPDGYTLNPAKRYILNPGSVGQPRDRDPRTSFALFDSEKMEIEIVRLRYDNQTAAQKIREAALPAFLAERLL